MTGYMRRRRTLFFPIRLESGSAWASRLIPSLIVQSWGWREQAAALSICTVTRRAFLLSWESSTPISVLMLFSKTKEVTTKEIRIGAAFNNDCRPNRRATGTKEACSEPTKPPRKVRKDCAGCHYEKRKKLPSPPCVEPPSPDLGCVLKCFSPLDVYTHYERSPAPPLVLS